MRARPFKQATTTAHPPMVTNEYVEEALAKQAANATEMMQDNLEKFGG